MDELWHRLDLTGEQLEVLIHMTLFRGAPPEELVRDVWPDLDEEAGLTRLDHVGAAINAVVSAATGKPGGILSCNGFMPGAAFGLHTDHFVDVEELYVEVR
jgi:hypothetical protein